MKFIYLSKISTFSAASSTGDYLYTPVNFKHSVTTEKGCIVLLIIPEEVEIL
jgi:hypothetical protein